MTNRKKIFQSFALGIKPEQRLEITKWARENVWLPTSSKSERADLDQTPWLTEVLQTIIDGDFEDVIFVAATGSGKSTLSEILACYTVLEKPAQAAFFLQTSTAAQVWVESRLYPTFLKNPKIKSLYPSNRHSIKKDGINFPHMNLWVRGCSIANTQSLSLDLAVIDEAWIVPDGSIQYISRRRHDRAFSQMFLCSQAGNTSSEFYEWTNDARQFEYHYKCPSCGEYHPWNFENLKFDKENFEDTHYVCPCGFKLEDTAEVRRNISSNGKYIELPTTNTNPKKISFIFNAGLNHTIEWSKLAREFVIANNKAKKFDFELLQTFKNQRLSQWWNNDQDIEFVKVEKSGYSLTDRVQLDKTLMSVDVQGQAGDTLMWYVVRTFDLNGNSRLIDFGRFAAYQDIVEKQKEWGLVGNQVCIDCAHKTDEVREFAAAHGYMTLNGVNSNSFPVTTKTGKIVNRVFGKMRTERTLKGKQCAYVPYASNRIKTICAGLRSSLQWIIPADIPDFYIKQLNAEKFEDGKWKQHKADNHAIDLDSMILVLAMIHGIQINTEDIKDEAT